MSHVARHNKFHSAKKHYLVTYIIYEGPLSVASCDSKKKLN